MNIPPAVVAKLGMRIEELQTLHAALTRVIGVAQAAGAPGDPTAA